jgi:hypothetical protein
VFVNFDGSLMMISTTALLVCLASFAVLFAFGAAVWMESHHE